jgi:hypothetical protein
MPRPHRDDIDWLGIGVRGICGAAFGAFVGFAWMHWGWYADSPWSWIEFGVAVVVCAGLAIRYSDDFWWKLRELIWWV